MKPASEKQLVDLLTDDGGALSDVLQKFERVICVSNKFWRPGNCKRLMLEGFIRPAVVSVDQVPAYLLGFHKSDDGGLWIDIAQTLDQGGRYPDLIAGIEKLARLEGCNHVRFFTSRRGVAERTRQAGFQVEAVLLTKAL